jgi:hypothetical protein
MNRLSISTFSSVAALLVFLPSNSIAQEKTIKEQLPGTWRLVSCEGGPACSNNPTGSLGMSVTGKYTLVMMAGGRPRGDADRSKLTPEQYKGIAQGVVAQFGTYTVNEADKTITRHTETSLMGGTQGVETKFNVSVTGDELKFTGTGQQGGISTWRRADAGLLVVGVAQEKTLKQQIQGPWSSVSCNSTDSRGAKLAFCSNNPKGILMLAGNGNFAGSTVAGGRSRENSSAPSAISTFGTWTVNEADKTLDRHIVGSNDPVLEGKDYKVNITLNGEEMRLKGDPTINGEVYHLDSTYRRFKQ